MTRSYIPEDVTTTGKDDWGKLRLFELLQERCHVSFIPWSQLQDQWFFLALWFIFWGKAHLNDNTRKWVWTCWTEMEPFGFLILLFCNSRDICILAVSVLSSDATHRSVYLDWISLCSPVSQLLHSNVLVQWDQTQWASSAPSFPLQSLWWVGQKARNCLYGHAVWPWASHKVTASLL